MGGITMDAKALAIRIVQYIVKHPGVTYDTLEEKAHSIGATGNTFEEAMQAVHKFPKVSKKARADGQIIYGETVVKEKVDIFKTRFEWIKDNYPAMDETNDAHHEIFADVDLSYLFMPPEEAKEWWFKKKYRPWELKV